MDGDPPRSGTRDNGLRCASYVGIADLDPRVADALLTTLRDEGIAAYVAPTPAQRGWSLEETRPARHTDRLWVDELHADRARTLVDGEQTDGDDPPPAGDLDFDEAWQQVLQSLQSPSAVPSRTYTAVDVAPADPTDEDEDEPDLHDPADDEHFEPPPPPPLPRLRPVTLGALAAIVVGLLILATDFDGGSFTVVAFVAIVGGVVSLIWNMRNGPPTDSGWDDGAVV